MHVVIVGCGRVGFALARRPAGDAATPSRSSTAGGRLRAARSHFGGHDRSPASASTAIVLIEAGIERAEAVAAVTNGDNSNILVARVARETFGIERVVARIYDPRRAAIYQRLGISTVATVAVDDRACAAPDPARRAGGRVGGPERQGVARRAHARRRPGPGDRCSTIEVAGACGSWPSAASARRCCPRPSSSSRRATSCTSPSPPTRWTASTPHRRRAGQGREPLMQVVIVGGGSVGRFIAEQLVGSGHDVRSSTTIPTSSPRRQSRRRAAA